MRVSISLTIVATCFLAGGQAKGVFGGEEAATGLPSRVDSVVIVASPAILPAGAFCRVETVPRRERDQDGFESDNVTLYEGTLSATTPTAVSLKATKESRRVTPIVPPRFAKDPEARRLFKTSGTTQTHPGGKAVSIAPGDVRSITVVALPSDPRKSGKDAKRPEGRAHGPRSSEDGLPIGNDRMKR